MAISRIQNQTPFTQRPNVDQNSSNVAMERLLPLPKRHYRNHNEIPDSVNRIKPEPGQGHLLNGGLFASIGRFFSNRIYDIKSVYKGYTGTANDHQLGRTNDVGLVLGGLGIASFLTTKRIATMPKHMEFVGLASFLTSMALWPKIGIFGPARAVHGFDADKRYIDDQGRNKSVFQDPNYVPFELFNGKKKSENISAIADYMGIAKDATNRNEMAKDQMRKIAIQNNTLWMLTSGVAVPTLTALLCNGFERVYEPLIVKHKASQYNKKLNAMYNELITTPKENNKSSDAAKKLLGKIMNFAALEDSEKILKGEDVINFANTVAKDSPSGISAALAKDITAMLTHPDKVVLDNKYIENLVKNIEVQFQGHKYLKNAIISFDDVLNALSPVKPQEGEQQKFKISEIKAAFNNNEPITKKQFELLLKDGVVVDKQRLINAVTKAVGQKIENTQFTNSGSISSETVLQRVKQMAINEINGNNIIPKSEKLIMTKDAALNIQKMAAPLAEYITRLQQLREINDLKMGNIADSQNAFFWKKLEKTFTNIVFPNNVITSKSFKTLVDNTDDIEKAARKNLEKLVRDEELYKKAIKEIDEIKMTYLKEIFGSNEAQYVQYNDFIKGSNQLNGVNWNVRTYGAYGTEIDKFIELQTKLANNFNTNIPQDTPFKNLMKVLINRPRDNAYNYTVAYHEVEENVKKIENFITACDRIIHSMDIYRRAHLGEIAPDKKPIEAEMFNQAKHNVIGAMSTDFFSKFNNRNRPLVFKDYMNLIYCENGYLDNATKQALQKESRYTVEGWIDKTRRLLFNDHANWQYSEFTNNNVFLKPYDDALLSSPNARFRAEGKNPVEFLNQGIKNSYNSNKWLRMFGGLFIGVFSLSIIAQFFFGKKDSTIPLEKDRIARLKQESLEKQNTDNNQKDLKPENKIEEEAANAN